MFNILVNEDELIEREGDYDNTESNAYLASVYAQLSVGNCAYGHASGAMNEVDC